ncbi:MAG TPA: zinc-dependent metalloprotease family protein [Polyangiales bacterium]|nr:zinc-dependent metalloprotease family protein [Polyangiales bacterium]
MPLLSIAAWLCVAGCQAAATAPAGAGRSAVGVGNYSGKDSTDEKAQGDKALNTVNRAAQAEGPDEGDAPPGGDGDDAPPGGDGDGDDAPPGGDGGMPLETPMRNTTEAAETATEAAADAEAEAEAEAADADAYVIRDARCGLRAPDPDRDGLCTALELEYGTDPNNADTDGDSLDDGMEVKGYRIRRTRERVLLPDANPLHRDIYVEIDYTPNFRPSNDAMEDVKRAFANSPVMNPDQTTGVTLHIDIDDVKPIQQAPTSISFPAEYSTIKEQNFAVSRSAAYHYALFAAQYNGSGSSGVAFPGGVDLMVTLGSEGFLNDRGEQAGTFMHELGHNLGLPHGGLKEGKVPDDTNFKPNYLSIMSYTYQFVGVPKHDASSALDYSRATVGAVSEAAINEAEGFGVSGSDQNALAQYDAPLLCLEQVRTDDYEDCNQFFRVPGSVPSANLDLNLNFCIDPGGVAADLNGYNGTNDTFPTVLDDWSNLSYAGNGVIGNLARINARVRTVETPTTCARANTLQAVSRVVVDNSAPPMCNPSGE